MKFIHMSDLHLGIAFDKLSRTKPSFKSRSLEMTERFFECLKIAQDENVEVLFLTGDLFDHAHVSIQFVEKVFKALSELSIDIYFTMGNHDDFLHNKAYQSLLYQKNIHVFDHNNHSYHKDHLDVYGFSTRSFNESKLLEINAALDQEKINVLCLHGDVENPQDDHFLTSLKTLKKLNFDYIALGHIHKHQFLSETIAYAGNIEPFDFSEGDDKGIIIGTLKPFRAQFRKTNKRHFVTLTLKINDNDDASSIKQKLDQKLTKHQKDNDFIRLVLEGVRSSDLKIAESLQSFLSDNLYYLEIIDKTRLDYQLDRLKDAYQGTIVEVLIDQHETSPSDIRALHKAIEVLLESEVKSHED